MADLPADVITNIFSRLPVRSLLQFRSVSKSCRFLIDSEHFKTLHFNNLHKSNSKLILRHYSELYPIDLPTPGNVVHLNKPLNFFESRISIIGSCNGLLCITNLSYDITIWNPSICKHWIIPRSPSISFFRNFCFFGCCNYGFGSFMGDYKLVEIFRDRCEVSLFSCRTNAWKNLPNVSCSLYSWCTNMGVFVDHSLHWAVSLYSPVSEEYVFAPPKLIVSFDFRFEVLNEVPLPDLGEGFEIEVSQLRGCLSMVVDYYSRIDFWVMKQYGSKDGWFKLFTSFDCLELRRPLKSLGYSSDGMKVLFQHRNKLIWYNFKSKQVCHVTNLGMSYFDEAVIWVESFVQPPFPTEYYRSSKSSRRRWNANIIQARESA